MIEQVDLLPDALADAAEAYDGRSASQNIKEEKSIKKIVLLISFAVAVVHVSALEGSDLKNTSINR